MCLLLENALSIALHLVNLINTFTEIVIALRRLFP
jgi:hypothetical protein